MGRFRRFRRLGKGRIGYNAAVGARLGRQGRGKRQHGAVRLCGRRQGHIIVTPFIGIRLHASNHIYGENGLAFVVVGNHFFRSGNRQRVGHGKCGRRGRTNDPPLGRNAQHVGNHHIVIAFTCRDDGIDRKERLVRRAEADTVSAPVILQRPVPARSDYGKHMGAVYRHGGRHRRLGDNNRVRNVHGHIRRAGRLLQESVCHGDLVETGVSQRRVVDIVRRSAAFLDGGTVSRPAIGHGRNAAVRNRVQREGFSNIGVYLLLCEGDEERRGNGNARSRGHRGGPDGTGGHRAEQVGRIALNGNGNPINEFAGVVYDKDLVEIQERGIAAAQSHHFQRRHARMQGVEGRPVPEVRQGVTACGQTAFQLRQHRYLQHGVVRRAGTQPGMVGGRARQVVIREGGHRGIGQVADQCGAAAQPVVRACRMVVASNGAAGQHHGTVQFHHTRRTQAAVAARAGGAARTALTTVAAPGACAAVAARTAVDIGRPASIKRSPPNTLTAAGADGGA